MSGISGFACEGFGINAFDVLGNYTVNCSIFLILNNFKNDCVQILTNLVNNPLNVDLQIISSTIRNIKEPYIIQESYSENHLVEGIENGFELLHDLSLKILEKKIATGKVDSDLLEIYRNCLLKSGEDQSLIDPKANELMRELARKDPVRFINMLDIDERPFSGTDYKSFSIYRDQIFTDKIDDTDGFEEFLKKVVADNSKNQELQKIWSNWKQFKDSGYKSYKVS